MNKLSRLIMLGFMVPSIGGAPLCLAATPPAATPAATIKTTPEATFTLRVFAVSFKRADIEPLLAAETTGKNPPAATLVAFWRAGKGRLTDTRTMLLNSNGDESFFERTTMIYLLKGMTYSGSYYGSEVPNYEQREIGASLRVKVLDRKADSAFCHLAYEASFAGPNPKITPPAIEDEHDAGANQSPESRRMTAYHPAPVTQKLEPATNALQQAQQDLARVRQELTAARSDLQGGQQRRARRQQEFNTQVINNLPRTVTQRITNDINLPFGVPVLIGGGTPALADDELLYIFAQLDK